MRKLLGIAEFEKMEKVDPIKKSVKNFVSIYKNEDVSISEHLLTELRADGEKLCLDLRRSSDYRILAFKKVENGGIEVPKGGKFKHSGLYRSVQEYGYSIPARYLFEKNEEEGLWYGYLEEVEAFVPSEKSIPLRKRRKGNETNA